MNTLTSLLACASAAMLLVACGGGSSSSSSDDSDSGSTPGETADKYAGSWRTECREDYAAGENPAFPSGRSHFTGLVLAKTGATAMNFTQNTAEYETPDCSGARTALFTSRGTVSLDGDKKIGNVQADKATFATSSGPVTIGKVLLWTSNGLLYKGTQSPRDAQGYPNQIEANEPWSPI
jgi:hypothetical protein